MTMTMIMIMMMVMMSMLELTLPRYNNVVRVRPRERTNTNTREGIDGIAPLETRRVSTESGYSSSTRQQEGELEKELEYANIFQPSAPVMTSDAENTEME